MLKYRPPLCVRVIDATIYSQPGSRNTSRARHSRRYLSARTHADLSPVGSPAGKNYQSVSLQRYVAAHEVKFWRCKTEPGESYRYTPYGFQRADVNRLLPGVPAAKIAKAFDELGAINLLTISDTGIWFAETLNEVSVNERVKHRALTMFNQLHPDTRDKHIKIPRRLLKLIIQCGRRIVRAATLFGLLLTTMLTKRTTQYEGYKGCCKAAWIGSSLA